MLDRKNDNNLILAIHDLSGYSRTSLLAIIPVLARMGFQVCALPTGVLSSNTEFEGYQMVEMTPQLQKFSEHWQQLGLTFRAIYTGFMASSRQAGIVQRIISDFRNEGQLVLVDPVMGDNGELYPCFDERMVTEMRLLCGSADLITPNLTEAALLLKRVVPECWDDALIRTWCEDLAKLGAPQVVLTGIRDREEKQIFILAGFDSLTGELTIIKDTHYHQSYPGTGDIFACVLLGCLLQGRTLPLALHLAHEFLNTAIRITETTARNPNAGIALEKALPFLPPNPVKYEDPQKV